MTTRCSCTADGLTEHGKCSTEFCYACSGTLSDEQINDSSYLSRSADESSKARLGDVCLPGDDHKLGARSKHFMPLLPANATSPDPSLSCYDAEDSHLTEGKQRLHRWREAGQALRDYLTQASGQVMTSQQTDALSRGGHFDQDTAHNLCAACWNVDIPMNTPSSAAQTGCIYTNLKSGCFAQGSSGLKYSEKTAPAFHVTNCDPDSWNSTEKGICQDIQVHPDESTPGDSHILPLLDGLQGKFGHLTDDRDKKKSGIPSDRRRHRLDERTKRRQLHSFSDSSSSDSEVRQLCQSASLRRNKRLTNKQSSFGKSRPSPDDDACGLVSNATGSQLVADSKHFVGINSMHWKNVTADSRLSQSKFLGDKVEKESSLCMEDSDSFSSSSPDTNSFSDSDVVDDPVIFPPVSSLKAVNDRLISQHPDPSTLCLSSDRLFPCSSSSASSSRHHSPLPLLCCDKERHCIAAELADKTDFMPFQSKVHCPVSGEWHIYTSVDCQKNCLIRNEVYFSDLFFNHLKL